MDFDLLLWHTGQIREGLGVKEGGGESRRFVPKTNEW